MLLRIHAVFLLLLFLSTSAFANEKIEGCFVAKSNCEALHSIKKQTNPGDIRLEPYELYSVTGQNRVPKPSHYMVTIEGAQRQQRWVPVECGNFVANCRLLAPVVTQDKQPQYLLALSWLPTFCETHAQKTECKTMTADRHDATYLSLHGLWPQPKNNAYCNVDDTTKAIDRRKRWDLLERLDLKDATRETLATIMPGYASDLQRHEWIKHGTCYGTDAETYYQHSIQLTQAVNQSAVGELLANNIGKKVSATSIRSAFDKAFGEGSGSKVNMRCDKKGRLSELWINLAGTITASSMMSNLLENAPAAKTDCNVGVVDPAGY